MHALPELVTEHLDEVHALCEKYHVRRLTLFGSAVKGTFDPERSDLDFVVEFFHHPDPLERGRRYLDLLMELQDLFERRIDLIVASTIKNEYFRELIELTERPLYEAA